MPTFTMFLPLKIGAEAPPFFVLPKIVVIVFAFGPTYISAVQERNEPPPEASFITRLNLPAPSPTVPPRLPPLPHSLRLPLLLRKGTQPLLRPMAPPPHVRRNLRSAAGIELRSRVPFAVPSRPLPPVPATSNDTLFLRGGGGRAAVRPAGVGVRGDVRERAGMWEAHVQAGAGF